MRCRKAGARGAIAFGWHDTAAQHLQISTGENAAWHGNSGIAFSNVCACVQEYNICFTTVVKGVRDGGADESTLAYDLPDKSLEQGVLPSVLRWAWPLARTSTLLPMGLPRAWRTRASRSALSPVATTACSRSH